MCVCAVGELELVVVAGLGARVLEPEGGGGRTGADMEARASWCEDGGGTLDRGRGGVSVQAGRGKRRGWTHLGGAEVRGAGPADCWHAARWADQDWRERSSGPMETHLLQRRQWTRSWSNFFTSGSARRAALRSSLAADFVLGPGVG